MPDLAAALHRDYDRGLRFNANLRYRETVEANENFFIGRQWEGVNSNGLPTPVFYFLTRVTLHQVASITSDCLVLRCSTPDLPAGEETAEILNNEFRALFEENRIPNLLREVLRSAAVTGDGCTYTWFDPSSPGPAGLRGSIRTEVMDGSRVFFGNPNDRRVETQPRILLARRLMTETVRDYARALGLGEDAVSAIRPEGEEYRTARRNPDEDRCTVLTRLRRDPSTGRILACECVGDTVLRPEFDMGISRYPITWLNWDPVPDCYHGQALITGLIPNQIFINKLFAMSMISLMTTAYPKIIYDRTRIREWSSRVGACIGVNGGDLDGAVKIVDPAQISPQIAQFIELAINYTQTFTGSTSAALGDVKPENTSAILALQRSAAIPSELTKQNLYQSVEDLGLIYAEFMAACYGERPVCPNGTPFLYDFSSLRSYPLRLKLDVGASSYWSEITSIQTLDNLLSAGKITLADYLERLPEGYIEGRRELLEKYKNGEPNA